MSDDDNPFAAPAADRPAEPEPKAPLPDIPAAANVDAVPVGPLVEVSSLPNVIEAELVRARLAGAGLAVALRDEQAVGVDPLLAVAVGGVKVLVAEADAPRARALLVRRKKPNARVFRVEHTSRGASALLGGCVGAALGGAASLALGPVAATVGFAAGVAVGLLRGGRVERHCSECRYALTLEHTTCPGCAGAVAGVIGHADERLAAEERLRDEERARAGE